MKSFYKRRQQEGFGLAFVCDLSILEVTRLETLVQFLSLQQILYEISIKFPSKADLIKVKLPTTREQPSRKQATFDADEKERKSIKSYGRQANIEGRGDNI